MQGLGSLTVVAFRCPVCSCPGASRLAFNDGSRRKRRARRRRFERNGSREARFRETYLEPFPGYYLSGDAGYIDEDGYLWIMSRIDDIINVAGHRLSTGSMEEVLAGHPDVAECAVIGVADAMKGQVPLGLVVLKSGVQRAPEEIVRELVARVREQIGAVAAFKQAVIVQRLPKTRSGKVLRSTMRSIADSQAYNVPATIDDPKILEEVEAALKGLGYAKGG